MPLRGLGQHELRAEGAQHDAPLEAQRLGHDDDAAVALHRGDERQRDAGVAAGRLDDHGLPGLDQAVALGRLDHREADAVLHAAGGVLALELRDDLRPLGRPCGHAVQAHQRRAADQLGDVVGDLHGVSWRGVGPGRSKVPRRARRACHAEQRVDQHGRVAPGRELEARGASSRSPALARATGRRDARAAPAARPARARRGAAGSPRDRCRSAAQRLALALGRRGRRQGHARAEDRPGRADLEARRAGLLALEVLDQEEAAGGAYASRRRRPRRRRAAADARASASLKTAAWSAESRKRASRRSRGQAPASPASSARGALGVRRPRRRSAASRSGWRAPRAGARRRARARARGRPGRRRARPAGSGCRAADRCAACGGGGARRARAGRAPRGRGRAAGSSPGTESHWRATATRSLRPA